MTKDPTPNHILVKGALVPRRTVREELQDLCDISLDDATGITWDLYRPTQKDKLELKVRLALFRESVAVDEETGETSVLLATDNASKSRDTLIGHVTDKIWDQMKHTGGTCLRMSIIYVGLVNANSLDPLAECDYMIRPLFRTMKCLDPHTRSARGKCMVFVDEFGWVYQNWKAFTEETLYPDTMVVAPVVGVFRRSDRGEVNLLYFKAPKTAEEIEKEKWSNIAMTVGGLGSMAVLGAAAVFPVAAPFVWGAIIVGSVVGLFTGAKAASELFNRTDHEQSISLADKESRAHWLVISGTVVGFAASGAASVLRGAATAGNVSTTVLYTSNSLFASSIFINGVSVGNSIWAVSTDDRPVTTGDILQISVSLFLFTHSVYNFQTAQGVVRDTQAQHLADYKQTLSKNGQKRFRNKLNRRMRENGVAKGTGDTIRNLNTAEHYNNNFKGTTAFQTSAGVAKNQRLHSNLANSFVHYLPESMELLGALYVVIVREEGEEVFELLKKMAEMILGRLGSTPGLSIENVLYNCYRIISENAEKRGLLIIDILKDFARRNFETIPRFVRDWFDLFIPSPGTERCETCAGVKYKI